MLTTTCLNSIDRELFGNENGLRPASTEMDSDGFLQMAKNQSENRRAEKIAAERGSVGPGGPGGPGEHPMPCTSRSDIHEIDPWDDERSQLSDPPEDPPEEPLEDPPEEPLSDPPEDPSEEPQEEPQDDEVLPPDMPRGPTIRIRPRNLRRSSMTPPEIEDGNDEQPPPRKRMHDSELDNWGKGAEAEPRPRPTKRRNVSPKTSANAHPKTVAKAKPKAKPVMCSIVWLDTTDAFVVAASTLIMVTILWPAKHCLSYAK